MVVYITTNLINEKQYIGIDSLNDESYLGSGIFLKKALKKYGRENFKKEIIEECFDKESLLKREIYWIEFYDAVKSRKFYNIHIGGQGGDIRYYMNDEKIEKWKSNISEGKMGKTKGIPLSEKNKKGISKGLKKYYSEGGDHPGTGLKRSEETKSKISNALSGRKFSEEHVKNLKKSFEKRDYNGENNPFYGNSSMSGGKNPMYGKSFYDVWVEKYGKEKADIMLEEREERRKEKAKLKKLKK